MARLPRLVIPYQPHHVIQRGAGGMAIFIDNADYQVFLRYLREAAKAYKVAIHAYVLMSNHIHLLATPSDSSGFGKMMQWLGRYYVPYFNRRHDRIGTLWQGRYRTSIIDSEHYLMVCSRYIELNPVRAGICARPEDYPWSSYRHHIGLEPDPTIFDHDLYWRLGNTPFDREAAYKALVESGISSDEMATLRGAVQRGVILGTVEFRQSLQKQTSRPIEPAKRGRPRKAVSNRDLSNHDGNL